MPRKRIHSNLPRLDDSAYSGHAFVHWNFSMKDRKRGWLDEQFHFRFREILLHSLGRFEAVCPTYCLMPNHVHLLLLGWSRTCPQRTLIRFLRTHTNRSLRPNGYEWQKQPYDNVLREKDRENDAFEKVASYVLNNPVRGTLVKRWQDWPYINAMIPGYPEIELRDEGYWERFWRIYYSKL